MLDQGWRGVRLGNRAENLKILEIMAENKPVTLRAQDEMANQGKTASQTEAGRVTTADLQAEKEKYKKLKGDLRIEMETKSREQELADQRERERLKQEADKHTKRMEEERKRQEEQHQIEAEESRRKHEREIELTRQRERNAEAERVRMQTRMENLLGPAAMHNSYGSAAMQNSYGYPQQQSTDLCSLYCCMSCLCPAWMEDDRMVCMVCGLPNYEGSLRSGHVECVTRAVYSGRRRPY